MTTNNVERRARNVALVALGLWGVLHIVGGGAEVATTLGDGGRAGLELLAENATARDIPAEPGPVAESVIAFHGFLIAACGVAVLAIVVGATRTRWPAGLFAALAIVAVADAGLIVFLVAPGYIPLSSALWGPALLALALVAVRLAGPNRVAAAHRS
jgi:hypothetical protein